MPPRKTKKPYIPQFMKGRPTDYEPEMCDIAYHAYSEGKSLAEVCCLLKIHHSTYYVYIEKHTNFTEACKLGIANGEAYWTEKAASGALDDESGIQPVLFQFYMMNRFKWTRRDTLEAKVETTVPEDNAAKWQAIKKLGLKDKFIDMEDKVQEQLKKDKETKHD